MEVLLVLVPFLVAGIAIVFIAFSGGPAAAREAYLTRGGRGFRVGMLLLYVLLGAAVPAVVIASRGEAEGGVGKTRTASLSTKEKEGKELFRQTCWSCHSLAAVDAQGVTGPNLDELAPDKERVLNAIKRGGTGDGRMPANLLEGEDAENVALYVSKVAGQ
ncbi:MAG: c-type cytochrome [Thermoleophilaceae bacterium]|nr:c-type cytochrome [Thermoleophilaceae bacterium]